jgi:ubiquinone/menaquinone biosynthesis C-methylase UbiE
MEKKKNVKPVAKGTSWEQEGKWYGDLVGKEGHHYHREVVFPKLLPQIIGGANNIKVLDLACGEGVFARQLPASAVYVGVDAASSLIQRARQFDKAPNHRYIVSDLTQPLQQIAEAPFTHAVIILALQNIANPLALLQNARKQLVLGGKLFIVLNHPCFRIPRQSSWGSDVDKKIQYRRIDRYLSTMEIPIQSHPSQGESSSSTVSFHYSLETITTACFQAGFSIELLEEWCSDKQSTGKNKKMEDRARNEIPLFLAIRAIATC